ncbi:MAG: hypothetical protein HZC22_19680, partial [Rhodocyclales bacterium]|nr:hypothetical protein [Rhodocyclales bacterium]
ADSVSAVILAFRLSVASPQDLRDHVTVGYLRDPGGGPAPENTYSSGFSIGDVLQGKAGWSEDEVHEFADWLESEPRLQRWLADQLEEINAAIRDSQVWESPMWTDEDTKGPDQ